MAGNITEIKAAITSTFQAILNLLNHRNFLSNDLVDSMYTKKDRLVQATQAGGTANIDFTNVDYYEFTQNASVSITFLGLAQDDGFKLLKIILSGTPTHTVTFANANDEATSPLYVQEDRSFIYYLLHVKDGGTISAFPLGNTLGQANEDRLGITQRATTTQAQAAALGQNLFINPETLNYVVRNKSHSHVNGSDYSVADGVGYVYDATNGTIRMPDPSLFEGQQIRIRTGTIVVLEIRQFDTTLIVSAGTDRYIVLNCDGTTWNRDLYETLPI